MAGKQSPKNPETPINDAASTAEPQMQSQTQPDAVSGASSDAQGASATGSGSIPTPQVADQQRKVEELTATIKYLQADYENYRKRVERDKSDYKLHAGRSFIESTLPIVDTFELCLKAAGNNEVAKGFELVYAQIVSMLESHGVKPIIAVGVYNPAFHEPLLQDTSTEPKGTIIEELQKGYMLGDKVLRATKVKISKGPA